MDYGRTPKFGVFPTPNADSVERVQEAGRDPAAIQRVYNVFGAITAGESEGFLNGPVDQWVDELTELVTDYGMDTFVFGCENDDVGQIRRFAAEVVPAVRHAVERQRSGA